VKPSGEPFEEQEEILPEIIERMNELRELFTSKELEQKRGQRLERLGSLFRKFQETEIPIERDSPTKINPSAARSI
jgi:deoxyhypusine synthase